jgi:long-chain acyl-CoA synthetase
MRGYYNLPEVNAETLEDGWLLTGDIGELDADGKLRITDRKKDLIKTSGGKYVAPQHLEGKLKAIGSGLISQVLVHGNARNFCTALITLDEEFIKKWAGDNGHAGKSYEELTQLPELNAKVQTCVDELNSGLARYETVKKFALLPQDFTVETGELTPSLKVKRKVVETRYKALLDGFYEGALKAV